MKLVIGNKAYSSWSFRPWILMTVLGIPFEEELVPLYREGSAEAIRRVSPGGKVPALIDGDVVVWESLAIIEYLADRFPGRGIWPAETAARAHARALSTEMHAGFQALRNRCPMNVRRAPKAVALGPEVEANVARIVSGWAEARERFGSGGPFLYGAFSAADAMYAPVVSRFHAYAVPVPQSARAYMDAVMALPAWSAWVAAGEAEPWHLADSDDVT
ncbi:glutathione S-transferase family protein [Phreatobacter cathodiphilus]|uniref:Glutathione S-transferase n=1 Tax=Phreatobacter cathodiphilus TaxID=1868589 RepID=A0A2S0NB09_9HYPH|nr:glutathione S-transferase family protein [Phreatobacter cathodiphilus]AVO45276.1 glutathione S-transferase [Phreatobacter cathodiphilus]